MYRSFLPVLLVAPFCLGLPGTPKHARDYGAVALELPADLASQWYDPYDAPSKKSAPSDPNAVYSCSGPDMNSYLKKDEWISFNDMWKINEPLIKDANGGADYGFFIRKSIEEISTNSKIDARLILGIIMQESTGNVTVHCTGVGAENACGIMQISQGSQFKTEDPAGSIHQMIKDGVYGTSKPGLLNYWAGLQTTWIKEEYYRNLHAALHIYNGGKIESHDLNTTEYGNLKSRAYANDMESRLLGWTGHNPGCSWSAGVGDASKFPDLQKCADMKLRDTSSCW